MKRDTIFDVWKHIALSTECGFIANDDLVSRQRSVVDLARHGALHHISKLICQRLTRCSRRTKHQNRSILIDRFLSELCDVCVV